MLKGMKGGHHGYLHEYVSKLEKDQEREMFQGMDAIEKTIGKRPKGFRSPAADFSENTLDFFEEFDFLYDSSLMGDDFNPYPLTNFNPQSRVVEIPLPGNWTTLRISNSFSIHTAQEESLPNPCF